MKLFVKVQKVKVNDLIPYHNNPKNHPPEQVNKIASSIKNYGFTQPIVIDDENEVIIGHGRLEAAKKLDMKEIPAIKRDDLNETQIKALRITDNKVAKSEWDMEMLEVEFEAIGDEFTGFTIEEIEEIKSNSKEIDLFDTDENDNTEVEHRCPKCGFEW